MATVTTSIGSASLSNAAISSVSGSGPTWTVTIAANSSVNGDQLLDEHATPRKWLIVSGGGTTSLIVEDHEGIGDSGGPDNSGTSTSQVGRYYSTITAWEADLDDTNVYATSDDAVGECYDDTDFNESGAVNMNGGTVGNTLTSVTLTVAAGERHDGTENSGVRIFQTADHELIDIATPNGLNGNYHVKWLELDGNGNNSTNMLNGNNQDAGDVGSASNLILHDTDSPNGLLAASTRDLLVHNCIFYGASRNGSSINCVNLDSDRAGGGFLSNTIYGTNNDSVTGDATGLRIATDDADLRVRNNIVMGTTVAGSGTALDFQWPATPLVNGGTTSNNMSEDATADDGGGSNHLINQTVDDFVSTTGGSEDLHLLLDSTPVGQGADLGTTPTGVNIDINGVDREAFTTPQSNRWSIGAHEGPATQTFSIGATGRDYSTITLWEADLDDTTVYLAWDVAIGECYDDSAFDEDVAISSATSGIASYTLSVASGERHDGTDGSGARLVRSGGGNPTIILCNVDLPQTVEWLEIDANDSAAVLAAIRISTGTNNTATVAQCLIHQMNSNDGHMYGIQNQNSELAVLNCFMWDLTQTQTSTAVLEGISLQTGRTSVIYNNTVHALTNNGGSGACYGIAFNDDVDFVLKNNISIDTGGTSSGTKQDYEQASPSVATTSNNIASDTSASGSDSHDSESSASLLVSNSAPFDLHLVSGAANAIDGGTDLGTTPSGVEIDIDGRDRDAQGDVWDIGAHEFVAAAGTAGGLIPQFMLFTSRRRRKR
jgi:hypothetical protein